jgi:CRP-like cAMP-binding protein
VPAALQKAGWPGGNLILAAVLPEDRAGLLPQLELVSLEARRELHAADERIAWLYFPASAVLATFGVSRKGATTHYALVGCEGFTGVNAVLGDLRAVGNTLVQNAGSCYRLPVHPVSEAFQRSATLRRVVLRYLSWHVAQISQSSLCTAHHPVDQRLSRWLLQSQDLAGTAGLHVTHELVATILGVRREAVTLAAHRLQARNAVVCTRGHFSVVDRPALEALACECYGLLKNDRVLLMKEISGPLPSNGSQAR